MCNVLFFGLQNERASDIGSARDRTPAAGVGRGSAGAGAKGPNVCVVVLQSE